MTVSFALWLALKTVAVCLIFLALIGIGTLAIVGWLTLKHQREFGKSR